MGNQKNIKLKSITRMVSDCFQNLNYIPTSPLDLCLGVRVGVSSSFSFLS